MKNVDTTVIPNDQYCFILHTDFESCVHYIFGYRSIPRIGDTSFNIPTEHIKALYIKTNIFEKCTNDFTFSL